MLRKFLSSLFVLAVLACSSGVSMAQSGTGVIRVKKVIIPGNDNGHFNLYIKNSLNVVVPGGQMQNAGNNGTLGPVTVPAGTYKVSEAPGYFTVGTDYTSAISGAGCDAQGNVTVTAGSSITCIITNTRKPSSTITVKKVTVPANDPGRFTLQITSSYPQLLANYLNAYGGATMGPVTLTSGSTYTINEIAGTGTNLSNYTQSITGAGCTNGIVNLTVGANIVCTIVNANNNATCTGWPLQVNVQITWTGIPAAQQTVHICRGGKVNFINSTTAQKGVQYLSGPTPFGALTLQVAGNTLSPLLPTAGNETYKFTGIGLTGVTTGTIVIH
jgi:hypothetical protein